MLAASGMPKPLLSHEDFEASTSDAKEAMAMAMIANDRSPGLDTPNVAGRHRRAADGAGQDQPMSLVKLHGRAFVDGALRDDILVTIRRTVIARRRADDAHPRAQAQRVEGIIAPGFIDCTCTAATAPISWTRTRALTRASSRFHARHGTTALAATTLSASRGDLQAAVETIARSAHGSSDGAEIVRHPSRRSVHQRRTRRRAGPGVDPSAPTFTKSAALLGAGAAD